MQPSQRAFLPVTGLLAVLSLAGLAACGGGEDAAADGDEDPGTHDAGQDAGGGRDTQNDPTCQVGSCEELTATGQGLLDLDRDGIVDCEEPATDADGDGRASCSDEDSDNDGIPDGEEGYDDSDLDGLADALDRDSDNDEILDEFEPAGDADADGLVNRLDTDSDGDGWLDAIEFGRQPGSGTPPVERDSDGTADAYDPDSDGDGVADLDELGCPESSERTQIDSDGDSVTDLLEDLFGSNPCDPASDLTGLVDFYFVLPHLLGDVQRDTLEFNTAISLGDVLINLDTTGSMGGQLNALRASLSSVIVPGLAEEIPNVGIGVSQFEDFPCGDFGGGGDVPFALLQRITTNRDAALAGVNALALGNGGDTPESGFESLYQIATGEGTNDCSPGLVPPFDPIRNLVVGEAEGILGGAGFRSGALPVVVHITDATSHARNEGGYTYGHTRDEAYAALQDIGGRVIGVATTASPRPDLEALAAETDARVPTCAWDAARPDDCAVGECCTGINGEGRAPVAGSCPLVFDVAANGSGLGDTIVSGIAALLRYAPTEVTIRVRADSAELARSGIDTSCFIQNVQPDAAFARAGACTTQPVPADTDGDGVNDGFAGVTPGANLFFIVDAYNDCVRATPEPQTFFAYLDVIAGGDVVLDTQLVTILVPPDIKNANEE